MMKGSDIGIQEKKAKLFNEWERFTSTDGESIESYYHRFSKLMNDFKRNKYFPEKIASNLKFLNNLQPEWSRHLPLFIKQGTLHTTDYTQFYDLEVQSKGDAAGWRFFRISSESGIQNIEIRMGLLLCPGITKQNPNRKWNYTIRPRRRDAAYLQTQRLNCSKGRSRNQFQAEELDFKLRTRRKKYTELTRTIPEPHKYTNDSNVISEVSSVEQDGGTVDQHPATVEETRAFFESLYNNLVTKVENVNTVNRKIKETNADLTIELARYRGQESVMKLSRKYDKLERCYQKSVYQEQCLTKKINALHLSSGKQITTLNEEISNLNKQLSKEKSTVSSLLEEKKKLKSDFKIREDELLDKQIQLENKIKELDYILVKTGQSIQTMHMLSPKPDPFYNTEQKMALGYQNHFYLKQAQQKQQSLYNGKVLLEKHDPFVVYDSKETLQLAQGSRLKMKQLNKEIKPANYTKINHLSGVFVSQMAKSQEDVT
ncbi:hypothetical protein Tco_1183318 [Tanacetum coccineum]